MLITNAGVSASYIKVYPQDNDVRPEYLMNWRRRRNDPWLIVERNFVNYLALGLPVPQELTQTVPDVSLPDSLEKYQKADVRKAMGLKHYLNANPMGLGKTPETVVYLKSLGLKNILIVTPKIIRSQWQQQLKAWGDFDATIYERQKAVDEGVWIINYDKLRNESVRTKFKRFRWDCLVLDEAHNIKNRNSVQTTAVKDIPAARKVALTGTPILRYVDDLWSILNFVDPFYSGSSYWSFVEFFCDVEATPWGNRIQGLTKDPYKVDILNQLMDYVSIRNSSVEVAQGKIREVIRLPMSRPQRELYRKEKNLLLDELPRTLTIPNGAVLTTRLRQTTTWPGLFIPGENGPKFEWVLNACTNHPEEKFVVFSTFERAVTALVRWLSLSGIQACDITGKRSDEENARAKEAFIHGNAQVLAGTIGAMGQGYDGLQDVCRLMICLDRDWSPEIMAQAEDRLHRKGQTLPVTIYYLECQGSFDQYVGKVNLRKASDIRAALKGE